MHVFKDRLSALCLCILIAIPLFAQTAYFRTTTNGRPWVDSGARAGSAWDTSTSCIQIFPDTQYQTIIGWGGCFQEKMWDAIQPLSDKGKDSVMRALFDTSGCNFNFCRVPVGCCDFDDNQPPISLDDHTGDYQMNYFSLHRDSTKKIPLIKMAQAINPSLRFWASPWSPPAWMHDNDQYHSGTMKSDSLTLAAYALYLEKFVKGYKDCGIGIESITCQNEPTINDQSYPTCGWSDSLELNFYKNYMIPLFKRDSISSRIILGVYCCGSYYDWITYFLNDPTVAGFVNATSHSWAASGWGPLAVASHPSIPFYQTESDYGPPPPGADIHQDWAAGLDQFNLVATFMNKRASVYDQWNMVNDETSKSGWGWAQYVMINVNSSTKQVTYNPHFYAQKHFSYYVKAGAKTVKYSTTGAVPGPTAAFRNPNGDVILVLANTNAPEFPLTVRINGMMYNASLPANSFNTLRIAGGAAVKERMLKNTAMPALNKARICNSMLYFTLLNAEGAKEITIALSDLHGRTVLTGRRGGSSILGEQQAFSLRSKQRGLPPGAYLLTVRIKNRDGAITKVESKLTAMN